MAEQVAEVRAESDELAVTERVLERVSDQLAYERLGPARATQLLRALLVLTNLEVNR